MAKLTLWTGLPGAGRRAEAMTRAMEASRGGGAVLWLVDSQRRAESIELELLERSGGAVAGVEAVVAGRLPIHLLQAAGRAVRTVPVEVRELMLRELVQERARSARLGLEVSDGWARRVADLYVRLTAGEEGLEQHLRRRYRWVLEVVEAYRGRLAEAGAVDEADLPAVAGGWLRRGGVPAPDLLIVDRLAPLMPSQRSLLDELALRSGGTLVPIDAVDEAGPSLDLARGQLEHWLQLDGIGEPEIRSFPVDAASAALARRLFYSAGGEEEDQPALELELGVEHRLSHHPDRAGEVRAAARRLAECIHEDGLAPEQTAVICTRLEEYEPLISDLFPRYGLHPDIRLGPRLDRNPVAKAVLSLFELRSAGLERERLTDLLLNPYVRWGRELSRPEGALAFDTAARRAGIRDRRGDFETTWRGPLLRVAERMRAEAESLVVEDLEDDPGTSETARRRRLLREAQRIERGVDDLRRLHGRLRELPDPCTIDEALGWLEGMLEELRVLESANRTGRRDPGEGGEDVRALGQLKLSLQHVSSALAFGGGERGSERRWPVARMTETLRFALRTARLKAAKRVRGGVQVGGPLELRGLRVRELIMLGMTASAWPRSPETDLADPLGGRWSVVDRLAESRALTFEALLAGDRVRFSTPTPRKGEGKEAPSPLLEEIGAAGVPLPEVDAGEGVDGVLRSALELLPLVGGNARAGAVSDDEDGELLGELDRAGLPVDTARTRRGVQVELMRTDPSNLTRYEGYLFGDPAAELIAARTLGRPLSATRLDSYASCPMQFFLGRVLGIQPLEEVEEEVEPRRLGGVVHEILARTVLRLTEERGGPPDLAQGAEEAERIAGEIAEELLAGLEPDNLYGDRMKELVRAGLGSASGETGMLAAALRTSADRLAGGLVRFVEAGFGLETGEGQAELLERPIRIESGGVTVELAGRLDRVDHHPDKGWRVFDYKLSKSQQPSAATTKLGLSFQLPVYTWALREWLAQGHGDPEEFEIARFFQIKPAKEGGYTVTLSTGWKKKDHDEAAAELAERVAAIQQAIAAGRFHHPLSQDDRLCNSNLQYNYCPFKHVCRRSTALFRERESKLRAEYLRDAYTLGFQQFASLEESGGGEGGDA